MTSRSSTSSIELMLHEIESTPEEHWTELLETLRQFHQNASQTRLSVINVEQAQKNQAAIDLLDSWMDDSEDASEHQQAWDCLKTALV
jgi:hypothetical protein